MEFLEGRVTDNTELTIHLSLIQKQTLRSLVRKRTILTDRRPLVDEIQCQLLWIEGCRVVSAADPLRSLITVF
jgi:hypothetical protein